MTTSQSCIRESKINILLKRSINWEIRLSLRWEKVQLILFFAVFKAKKLTQRQSGMWSMELTCNHEASIPVLGNILIRNQNKLSVIQNPSILKKKKSRLYQVATVVPQIWWPHAVKANCPLLFCTLGNGYLK